MEKEVKQLYTLKHNSVLDGEETIIPFVGPNGEEKKALTLTEIDAYTTIFENSQEFMHQLNSLGYNFYNSHFFIEYYHNGQRKKTTLVFSDQDTLRQFALNNQGENNVKKDIEFYRYVINLLKEVEEDPEMLRYLKRNGYIWSRLKDNIERYNARKGVDLEESNICRKFTENKLLSYKAIRDIEIGKKEYEEAKKFDQQMEERKKAFVKQKLRSINNQGQLFNPDNY